MSGRLARIDRFINRLVKNATLWIFIALLLLGIIAVRAWHVVFPVGPEPAVYGSMHLIDQGWVDTPPSATDPLPRSPRQKFYQTSQGNLVMPFSWFTALERQPQGFPPRLNEVNLFSSPSVQARYGLLPDTSRYNPHQLPVGIVKDVLADEVVDVLGQGQREWIGISCAACHTGQLLYKGQAVRIDGGNSLWNFTRWSTDLVGNLTLTTALPGRFDRFARRVFKTERKEDSKAHRRELQKAIRVYLNSPLITQAIDAAFNHTYPATEGPARTAALGRGVNGEFGLLDPRNIEPNRGPVSYPPLWYTHDYDWVQSVGAIRQPMGRNITEAWGVSVRVKLDQPNRYLSTARLQDLFWIETLLSTMKAPAWPGEILGPVNANRKPNGRYKDPQDERVRYRYEDPQVERGRYLYEEAEWARALTPAKEQLEPGGTVLPPVRVRPGYCARCHSPVLEPGEGSDNYDNRYIQLPLYRLDVLGTDAYDAEEFAARKPYTGILADDFGGLKQLPNVGVALQTMIGGIENKWYADRNVSPRCRQIMNGFRDNLFRAPLAYPARPMAGYWATAPYLHNGSVRTLYQLLSPVDQRDKTFYVGSFEFDPVAVGYRDQRIDGAFLYDTSVKGNSNAGHEFRDAPKGTPGVIGPFLSPEDRRAIVQYMKVMNDIDDSGIVPPQALEQRRLILALMSQQYEGKGGYRGYEPADEPEMKMDTFCAKLVALVDALASGAQKTSTYLAGPAPAYSAAPAAALPVAAAAAPSPTPAPNGGGGR